MQKFKYLIVGGGVAGTTAAETIRSKDAEGSLAIVSDEPYVFYSRIMLSKPNFFLGKTAFDAIWLRKREWYEQKKIQIFLGRSAVELNPLEKTLKLDNGEILGYEKLLLAFGARAAEWPGDEGKKAGIYYLRTLDHAKAIISAIKTAKKVVLLGGGFVGFEMCDLVRMAGLSATLVMREKYFWDFLWDEESGQMLEAALTRGGVELAHSRVVEKITGESKVEGVKLSDGSEIACDALIIGIGVKYPLAWLAGSGVKTNRGVLADEFLQTNLADVWTAGDVAEYQDAILNERVQLGNWVNAQEQGRRAGLNMAGEKQAFKFVSFYTAQGFGISVAFVGNVAVVPGRDVVHRGSSQIGSYARILVQGDHVVGATMLNRTKDLGLISKLIEKKVSVGDKHIQLADSDFDLKSLL